MNNCMKNIDLLNELTVVIPTYNRNYYLSRLLSYLKKNSICNIIIADSSNPEKHVINKNLIDSIFSEDDLNLRYFWYPEKESASTIYHKIASALEMVKTPYATLCADKDIPIGSGLVQCLSFLKGHPDYHIVDGRFFTFQINYLEKKLQWRNGYTNKRSITVEKPIHRIKNLLLDYHPLSYSIHRTETLQSAYANVVKYTDDFRFGEIFSGIYPLVCGKYAYIDANYWCRENNPVLSTSRRLPGLDSYWEDGSYSFKYNKFKNGIKAAISNISYEEIDTILDPAMETYLKINYPFFHNGNYYNKMFTSLQTFYRRYLSSKQKEHLIKFMNRIHLLSPEISWKKEDEIHHNLLEIHYYLLSVANNYRYTEDQPIMIEELLEG